MLCYDLRARHCCVDPKHHHVFSLPRTAVCTSARSSLTAPPHPIPPPAPRPLLHPSLLDPRAQNPRHDNRIPFALATSLGLAALAMQLPLTGDEAGAGLVPPATALFVLGKGGATLILIMLFMAVTSTGSAELIAVSSLVSYDIYRAYIKPDATGEEILKVCVAALCTFCVWCFCRPV